MSASLIPGTLNARDLGGIAVADGRRVRKGRVIRTDAPGDLVAEDVRVVEAMGLRCAIDLRSSAEIAAEPVSAALASAVEVRHLPLWDGERASAGREVMSLPLADKYLLLAQVAASGVGEVLDAVVRHEGAVAFFCSFGKDRTGLVAACLLAALGAEDEAIVEDYARTDSVMPALTARHRTAMSALVSHLPEQDLRAEPETMHAFLASIRGAYGTMEAYLEDAGLDATWIAMARARLLEVPWSSSAAEAGP